MIDSGEPQPSRFVRELIGAWEASSTTPTRTAVSIDLEVGGVPLSLDAAFTAFASLSTDPRVDCSVCRPTLAVRLQSTPDIAVDAMSWDDVELDGQPTLYLLGNRIFLSLDDSEMYRSRIELPKQITQPVSKVFFASSYRSLRSRACALNGFEYVRVLYVEAFLRETAPSVH